VNDVTVSEVAPTAAPAERVTIWVCPAKSSRRNVFPDDAAYAIALIGTDVMAPPVERPLLSVEGVMIVGAGGTRPVMSLA
jgi:hypothetical protein